MAVLLLLIAVFQPRDRGPSVDDTVAQRLTPVSDSVSALEERLKTVEASLEGAVARLEASVSADDLSAVQSKVEDALAKVESAVSSEDLSDVQSKVEAALADVSGSLRGSIDELQNKLADTVASVEEVKREPAAAAASTAAVAATTAPAATDSSDASQTQTADTSSAAGDGYSPGMTALFDDGALRVFVSRVDADAGDVWVSMTGEMKRLTQGQPRVVAVGRDYCRITVDSISGNTAMFSSLCGDDLPAPEGLSAGQTASLQDGAMRVFVSRVEEDAARLFINGEQDIVDVGRSVAAKAGDTACRVYLDAVDRGHASVSALCGDDMPVSEAAGAGSTVTLDDGAVRVFVASVQDDTARFAINGQTVVAGMSGETVALGDGCGVTVEDVKDATASFSYACK
ncbi:MAG: hypothetical protein AAGF79_02075 [Pseudomonadota bacterium]